VRNEPNMEIPALPPCVLIPSDSGVLAGAPTSHEGAARLSRRSRSNARCLSISGVSVRAWDGVVTGELAMRGGG
jgi:hypothetical protein